MAAVKHIRTEDDVVHLPSPANGDVGQPLCYEPSRRLPPRGSAVATDDAATCPGCHHRRIEAARHRLDTAVSEAVAAGVDVGDLVGRHGDPGASTDRGGAPGGGWTSGPRR